MTDEARAARTLLQTLIDALKDPQGRVRAEELISAAAAIAGERTIAAAGEFDPRNHDFTPGSRVFSDRVNELFSGEIVGMIRDGVVGRGYTLAEFPPLEDVIRHFAANVGDPAGWGRVPLSVAKENQPDLMPLRAAYETRAAVDKIAGNADAAGALRIAVRAVAEALVAVKDAIDHRTALSIALETINGMAKTAPMTDAAFRAAAAESAPS